jgi:hypothetical protein
MGGQVAHAVEQWTSTQRMLGMMEMRDLRGAKSWFCALFAARILSLSALWPWVVWCLALHSGVGPSEQLLAVSVVGKLVVA